MMGVAFACGCGEGECGEGGAAEVFDAEVAFAVFFEVFGEEAYEGLFGLWHFGGCGCGCVAHADGLLGDGAGVAFGVDAQGQECG